MSDPNRTQRKYGLPSIGPATVVATCIIAIVSLLGSLISYNARHFAMPQSNHGPRITPEVALRGSPDSIPLEELFASPDPMRSSSAQSFIRIEVNGIEVNSSLQPRDASSATSKGELVLRLDATGTGSIEIRISTTGSRELSDEPKLMKWDLNGDARRMSYILYPVASRVSATIEGDSNGSTFKHIVTYEVK